MSASVVDIVAQLRRHCVDSITSHPFDNLLNFSENSRKIAGRLFSVKLLLFRTMLNRKVSLTELYCILATTLNQTSCSRVIDVAAVEVSGTSPGEVHTVGWPQSGLPVR